MHSWALEGGPDDEAVKRHVLQEDLNDTELAALYGVTRQTASYWRLRAGIDKPGRGHGPRPHNPNRVSHKGLVHWRVRQAHINNPIRKRLVEVSLQRQEVALSRDAQARVEDFLAFLERENVVVDYDPSRDEPFYFVPRDPSVDAKDDIVRR